MLTIRVFNDDDNNTVKTRDLFNFGTNAMSTKITCGNKFSISTILSVL